MSFYDVFSIAPYNWQAILTSIFCGTIIGIERQIRGKPVGIRTSSLIILGTYLFVATAINVSTAVSDPSRIIGQVITGVGFLGAGVMLAKDGAVVGVTSAATIWVLSAIGVCIANNTYWVAIKLSIVVVLILTCVDLLEKYSQAFTRGVHSKYSGWRNQSQQNRIQKKMKMKSKDKF